MAIKKHPQSGIYWIDITPPGGKRVRRSTGTSVRRDALEYHDRLKAQLWRETQLGEAPRRHFEEACVLFLKDSKGQSDYKTKIRHTKYWREQFAGKTICSLTTEDILNALPTHRTREGLPAIPLQPATKNRYLSTIRRMLTLSVEAGWISTAPKLRPQKEPAVRIRWLTQSQAKALLMYLRLEWMRDLCAFALATGCRQSEICTLTWDSIDLKQDIAWIHGDLAKSSKARVIPLNSDALSVIESRKGKHKKLVFSRVPDGPAILDLDYRDFNQALKRTGVDNFSFHDLRHTWASWHVQNGTPLFALKEMGGWETLEMVKRYAHMNAGHLARHANSVIFGSQPQQKKEKAA